MNKSKGYWRRKLAEATFGLHLINLNIDNVLKDHLPLYNQLLPFEKKEFRRKVITFIKCKKFIGMDGFQITNYHKVVISALAVRLVFRLGLRYYDHINRIYIFEKEFDTLESEQKLGGITHSTGLIGLSWEAIFEGIMNPHDGKCVTSHEFAHALDLYDGDFDGLPGIFRRKVLKQFISLIFKEHEDFINDWEDWHRIIYKHKVKDISEFFAAITEIYFENPVLLKDNQSNLYNLLKSIYKYEPAPD